MHHHYRAHGLEIVSDLKFPEIPEISESLDPEVGGDLRITRSDIDAFDGPQDLRCVTVGETSTLLYPGVARIQATRGSELRYQPLGSADDHLRLFLLGCGLSMICEQRRWLVLHAASIYRDGVTMLLCGQRGAGKSTTTAALLERGWKLLSDDVTVLRGTLASPAYPYLRLWPPSFDLLQLDAPQAYPRVISDQEKRRVSLPPDRFQSASHTVSLVVEIHTGEKLTSSLLRPGAEALMTLVTNSQNAGWGPEGFTPEMAAHHFGLCSQLVRTVPIWKIQRPTGARFLPAFLEALEALGGPVTQA